MKILKTILPLFLISGILLCPACAERKCPANGGGYIDKPKPVGRNHKPSSGLWPKGMKR
ncbi:MAG: hypothetical protein NTX03_03735 [Bacteroidetes bacterium]|nr:hypothetical protein [Bacteroidota bacterium]